MDIDDVRRVTIETVDTTEKIYTSEPVPRNMVIMHLFNKDDEEFIIRMSEQDVIFIWNTIARNLNLYTGGGCLTVSSTYPMYLNRS